MAKKKLTAIERARRYGRNIKGMGIFWLIVDFMIASLNFKLLANPLFIFLVFFTMTICVAMIITGGRASKRAIGIGWIFEIYLLALFVAFQFNVIEIYDKSILPFLALIVIIGLPADIIGLTKALKEIKDNNEN